MYVHKHVHIHIWRPEEGVSCSPSVIFTDSFEARSLLEDGAFARLEVSIPQQSSCLCPHLSCSYRYFQGYLVCYMGAET